MCAGGLPPSPFVTPFGVQRDRLLSAAGRSCPLAATRSTIVTTALRGWRGSYTSERRDTGPLVSYYDSSVWMYCLRPDGMGSRTPTSTMPSRHATVVEEVAEDPLRYLLIGPDRSGNLLELIVLDQPQGPAVMHAMVLRAKYRRLLPPGE